MEPDTVMRIANEAMMLTLILSLAPIAGAVVIGLLISVMQAATQIQEQTLTIVPKITIILVTLMIIGPWILRQLIQFATLLFNAIPTI
jgi:flagellar biosynthetic protein FliQ